MNLPFRKPNIIQHQDRSHVQRNPKPEKCEIVIKKGQNGEIKKSIRGTCSKAQLEALSQKSIDIEDDTY